MQGPRRQAGRPSRGRAWPRRRGPQRGLTLGPPGALLSLAAAPPERPGCVSLGLGGGEAAPKDSRHVGSECRPGSAGASDPGAVAGGVPEQPDRPPVNRLFRGSAQSPLQGQQRRLQQPVPAVPRGRPQVRLSHQLLPGQRWAHLRVQLHSKPGEALPRDPTYQRLNPPTPHTSPPTPHQTPAPSLMSSHIWFSHANTPTFLAYLLSPTAILLHPSPHTNTPAP